MLGATDSARQYANPRESLGEYTMIRVSPLRWAVLGCAAFGLGGCISMAIGAGATTAVAASSEKGIGGTVDDTIIRTTINTLWMDTNIDMWRELGLDVSEGRVLITGKVDKPEWRVEAVKAAWRAEGVKEVINEIKVTDEGGLGNYARDAWISNQLRTRLLFDKQVMAVNYSVDTVDQVIYLMGIARDQHELDVVINYARSLAYVKQVVNYVILRDDPRRKEEAA
jgi:osmotically-inducible protein OsmY